MPSGKEEKVQKKSDSSKKLCEAFDNNELKLFKEILASLDNEDEIIKKNTTSFMRAIAISAESKLDFLRALVEKKFDLSVEIKSDALNDFNKQADFKTLVPYSVILMAARFNANPAVITGLLDIMLREVPDSVMRQEILDRTLLVMMANTALTDPSALIVELVTRKANINYQLRYLPPKDPRNRQHNIHSRQTITPLANAIQQSASLKVVQKCLELKADAKQTDKEHATLLHRAVQYSTPDVVATLLPLVDTTAIYHGQLAIHVALTDNKRVAAAQLSTLEDMQKAEKNQQEIIETLLQLDSKCANARNKEGKTPLHLLPVLSTELIKLLLSFKADITLKDNNNKTVFMELCSNEDIIYEARCYIAAALDKLTQKWINEKLAEAKGKEEKQSKTLLSSAEEKHIRNEAALELATVFIPDDYSTTFRDELVKPILKGTFRKDRLENAEILLEKMRAVQPSLSDAQLPPAILDCMSRPYSSFVNTELKAEERRVKNTLEKQNEKQLRLPVLSFGDKKRSPEQEIDRESKVNQTGSSNSKKHKSEPAALPTPPEPSLLLRLS